MAPHSTGAIIQLNQTLKQVHIATTLTSRSLKTKLVLYTNRVIHDICRSFNSHFTDYFILYVYTCFVFSAFAPRGLSSTFDKTNQLRCLVRFTFPPNSLVSNEWIVSVHRDCMVICSNATQMVSIFVCKEDNCCLRNWLSWYVLTSFSDVSHRHYFSFGLRNRYMLL